MTAEDFQGYLSRLESELDEGPLDATRGILNGIAMGFATWALIGFAVGAILWVCR